jgi:hypothetical protein
VIVDAGLYQCPSWQLGAKSGISGNDGLRDDVTHEDSTLIIIRASNTHHATKERKNSSGALLEKG